MKFKSGKYYIGDLCYIFDDSWPKVLNVSDYFRVGGFEFESLPMFGSSTKYGDGVFYDNEDYEYCVDAGILGIAPFEAIAIDNRADIDYLMGMGRIVEFDSDFEVSVDKNCRFTFGDIIINTEDEGI